MGLVFSFFLIVTHSLFAPLILSVVQYTQGSRGVLAYIQGEKKNYRTEPTVAVHDILHHQSSNLLSFPNPHVCTPPSFLGLTSSPAQAALGASSQDTLAVDVAALPLHP